MFQGPRFVAGPVYFGNALSPHVVGFALSGTRYSRMRWRLMQG